MKKSFSSAIQFIYLLSLFFSKVVQCSTYESLTDETSMPYPVSDMTANLFPGSLFSDSKGARIYLVGGCISDQLCAVNSTTGYASCSCQKITNKCVYFNPGTGVGNGEWNTCASAPTERYRHMSAVVNNYLYVAGGRYLNDTIVKNVDRYDPVKNVWTTLFQWVAATSDGSAFSLDNRYLRIAGGYDPYYESLASVTIYDTYHNNITLGTPMNLGRGDTGVAILNGVAYVLGGWNTAQGFCTPVKEFEMYDEVNNKWITKAKMAEARGDLATGVLGGYIFSIAGETKKTGDATCTNSVPVANVGRYNVANNSWTIEESLTSNRFRFIGVSYNISSFFGIYLFGGQTTYNSSTKSFPIVSTTLKYVPYSVVSSSSSSSSKKLSSGGIAGIVIAAIIVAAIIAFCTISYLTYRRTKGYFLHTENVTPIVVQSRDQP